MNSTKSVIVYLARSSEEDVRDLCRSLTLLKKNFLRRFPYPVVVFVETSFRETWKKELREGSKVNCRFETIEFCLPDFLDSAAIPEYVLQPKFKIGYRHMCRFFSGKIYDEPSLQGYKWYWRLDTDSFLLGKVKYDVFQLMEQKGCVYGYSAMSRDEPLVSAGLWELTKDYIEKRGIQPTFVYDYVPNGVWDRSYYYTNFEISSFEFWRSKPARDYFNHVDRSGGIYQHRWGDTLIHTMTVGMFLPKAQTHRFTDIYYDHQGAQNKPPDKIPYVRNFLKKVLRMSGKPGGKIKRLLLRIAEILAPPPPDNFFKKIGRKFYKIGHKH